MINGVNSVNFGCEIVDNKCLPKTSKEVLDKTIENSKIVREAVLTAKQETGVPLTKVEEASLACLKAQRLLKPLVTPTGLYTNGSKGVCPLSFGSNYITKSRRILNKETSYGYLNSPNEYINPSLAKKISDLNDDSVDIIMAYDKDEATNFDKSNESISPLRVFPNIILNSLEDLEIEFISQSKNRIDFKLGDGREGVILKASNEEGQDNYWYHIVIFKQGIKTKDIDIDKDIESKYDEAFSVFPGSSEPEGISYYRYLGKNDYNSMIPQKPRQFSGELNEIEKDIENYKDKIDANLTAAILYETDKRREYYKK